MEILDHQFAENKGEEGLQVTRDMKINWLSTSKWAMFFAVLGFINAGVTLLMAGVMMPMMRSMMVMSGQAELAAVMESAGIFFTLLIVLAAAAAFLLSLFHLRFSTGIQRAMQFDDQNAFESAWQNLRNYFRLYGILIIVYIVLYLIALIFIGNMVASGPEF